MPSRLTKITRRAIIITMLSMILLSGSVLSEETSLMSANENWCGTQVIYDKMVREAGLGRSPAACVQKGICDDPGTRDGWIPDTLTSITTLRMVVHVLAYDDGSNPISTVEEVQRHVDDLNAIFLPYALQFENTTNFVNSTAWRTLSEGEINAMKAGTAIAPDSTINIWVTQVDYGYSFGTFPWDQIRNPLSWKGGVVMGHFHWGGSSSTFAHEVGHTIGLYHTHNGVDEVTQCGTCYEPVGAADANVLGDRCADTPPTPTWYNCSNASGSDPCSGQPWGFTMPRNFMAYTPDNCQNMFTPQQAGRMHCWINDRLSNWIVGVQFVGTPTFGPVPMSVDFTSSTAKTVSSWTWNFGDGGSSSIANPTHMYSQAGYHTVSVDIQTTDGPYTASYPGYVSAYADTLESIDVTGQAGLSVRIDIYARNYLPLTELTIPVVWDGPFFLTYDSISTVGLRTDYFQQKSLLNLDVNNKRLTVFLRSSSFGALPALAPDTGAVVSVYLRIPNWVQSGSNPIDLSGYTVFQPEFVTTAGSYVPVETAGSVSVSCCKGVVGNVNNDFLSIVDIADLTSLIAYLFIPPNIPPVCLSEANVDADPSGIVDIADLTELIDYLFLSSSPALLLCQ